jgi:glycosyltransferase involved in cell wall biosynthesis
MRISCIIPVFNGERYVAEALDSVLAQELAPSEIIVVDDGSTDGTADVLRTYAGSMRVVRQPNLGVSAARNAGLRAATGDVIAFLDSDDLWPAGRMKVLAASLAADDGADVVAGLVETLDQRPARPAVREDLRTMHRVHLVGSTLMRRSVFERVGAFNEALRVVEDTEFIVRARAGGITFKTIDAISLIYRLHETNISQDLGRTHSFALDAMRAALRRRRGR